MSACSCAISRTGPVLLDAAELDEQLVGVAGHSYGGCTALYHAAVDVRCRFACVSGAVCSFATRRREDTGITLFETVPDLARQIDTHDVLSAIGPRPTLVVSGTEDKYSRDADQVVAKVAGDFITELRVDRGHALDQERFDAIVEWLVNRVATTVTSGWWSRYRGARRRPLRRGVENVDASPAFIFSLSQPHFAALDVVGRSDVCDNAKAKAAIEPYACRYYDLAHAFALSGTISHVCKELAHVLGTKEGLRPSASPRANNPE